MLVNIQSAKYHSEQKSDTIRNINFSVGSGEMIGLIGTNGAGKSTILRSILGLMDEMNGQITFTKDTIPYAYVPEQPIYYDYLKEKALVLNVYLRDWGYLRFFIRMTIACFIATLGVPPWIRFIIIAFYSFFIWNEYNQIKNRFYAHPFMKIQSTYMNE